MPLPQVARRRLRTQRLTGKRYRSVAEVVSALTAVQSQDYGAARWGVGQRTAGLRDADLDTALNDGTILRTHVMRPTWHFVMPADIRWMQALTASRVHALSASYYRKMGVDAALVTRSRKILERVLRDGNHLTREGLGAALRTEGVPLENLPLSFLTGHLELDCVLCSGALHGKQQTYALVDERAPAGPTKSRDDSLAELATRYFTSHGPALPHDMAWWSGLTLADVRKGIDLAGAALVAEELDGKRYWSGAGEPNSARGAGSAHLLPNYDEYFISYRDRGAAYDATRFKTAIATGIFDRHIVVLDGQLVGGWKRTLAKGRALVEATILRPLTEAERTALAAAAESYGAFIGMPVDLRGI